MSDTTGPPAGKSVIIRFFFSYRRFLVDRKLQYLWAGNHTEKHSDTNQGALNQRTSHLPRRAAQWETQEDRVGTSENT